MKTEFIYALFWFTMGAFLHHAIFIFRSIKEKQEFYAEFAKNMTALSSVFLGQLRNVVDIKKSIMKEMGLDDKKIEEECKVEETFVKNWKVLYATTILTNMPRDIASKIVKKELP